MGQTLDTRVIKKFKHRLTVCSQADVVVENKTMVLSRKGIYTGWAMITNRRASAFSVEGQTVLEPREQRTHYIIMRYRSDIEITTAAWLHEARLKSAPRWFKILNVMDENELGEYWKFEVRLMENSDEAIEPTAPNQGHLYVPEGIKL